MNKSSDIVPLVDTLTELLLVLTALSGDFPETLIERLPGTKAYQKKVVNACKRDNLLRSYSRNDIQSLRLTTAAKKKLCATAPAWFLPYLTGSSETNRLKCEPARRYRLHQMAEVLLTMYKSNVSVFPWEKPAVFQPEPLVRQIERPSYYSSREIKEIGPQMNKIRGSRATGVLLSDGGIFVVYNTGSSASKWEYKAEMRLKAMLEMEICRRRLSDQFGDAVLHGIVFGADMGRLDSLMDADGSSSHNYFLLDGSFRHSFFLTSDRYGEAVLRLLYDSELCATLDALMMEDLTPAKVDSSIENDAMDGETFVLFGYTCDMPRLRRFRDALEHYERDGMVICFDFQEEAYSRCLGPRIELVPLNFAECERRIFQSPESN